MSIIGSFFGKSEPDEKYLDDQSVQEDRSNDPFVGMAIDTARATYDTMFDALKYVIRGKGNVISKMDDTILKLEKRCEYIVAKYKEILGKLDDAGASLPIGATLDFAKEAFSLLDSNPVLRRYIGEANYWVLWDTLATLSSQGAAIDSGILSNIKGAIKTALYAMLSMTNGLMHFESYIGQITQFWGWLYAKEIWLPLTDSICPQVTCEYFYKPADNGQLEGSDPANKGPDRINPVPGAASFAPMPIPVFDYTKSPEELKAFAYDNPDTWDVLVPASKDAFTKAYKYWRSNYTNASSVNDLLSAASSALTGGSVTAGFGTRKHNHPLGTPLQVGRTFAQLYSKMNEQYPVELVADDLLDAYGNVDAALAELATELSDSDVCNRRDAAIMAAFADPDLAGLGYSDGSDMIGEWWCTNMGPTGTTPETVATDACYSVVSELRSFRLYMAALSDLSAKYRADVGYDPDFTPSAFSFNAIECPLVIYLKNLYTKLAESAETSTIKDILKKGETSPEMYWPYGVLTETPEDHSHDIYLCGMSAITAGEGFFYTEAGDVMAFEIDVDSEVGRKVDHGRKPLFAAIGVYGNLLGLYPWEYKVVQYDPFREKYTRIKGSFHIYYRNDNPSEIVFADNIIRVGILKYVVMCKAAASDTISRGSESYTSYIFPSETCSVSIMPPENTAFGLDFANFASIQRTDAEGPDGTRYKYDLTTNVIPRWPKYVDPEKWSVMDLIHELFLLADSLSPLCGDGGRRRYELLDLLNEFGIVADGPSGGPRFLGQLPNDSGQHVRIEFKIMNDFAGRLKKAIDAVYTARDALIAATQNW